MTDLHPNSEDPNSEQATEDVTASTAGYGGPVSDEELAEVYLPEGQSVVSDPAVSDPPVSDPAQSNPRGDDAGKLSGSGAVPDGSGSERLEDPDSVSTRPESSGETATPDNAEQPD